MTTKEQQEQLQNTIWKIANEVRGAVDGWDFKQFVLGTLFYRFTSLVSLKEMTKVLTMQAWQTVSSHLN